MGQLAHTTRLARLAALIFDRFNLTPYSIGHHELLENDNIPKVNALPMILGRPPKPIVAVIDCGSRVNVIESLQENPEISFE